ncbi:hypothetical protein ABZW30_30895 [Kitasatospora sp. NPDC004669]|uniref:nuclear transport factor 2 family protein n=1 Tax=Kitasatospora sp. NPDC004669 TaxID=3154555 RepID=UPI0033A4FDB3
MWGEPHSEPVAYRSGGHVVVHGVLADGDPLDITAADVFTVRDGRIVGMRAYADPSEVLQGGGASCPDSASVVDPRWNGSCRSDAESAGVGCCAVLAAFDAPRLN